MPTQTWELWEGERDEGNHDGITFFPSPIHPDNKWMIAHSKKVWEVVANSYNQAMRLQHAYYDWEPYKPMVDADGNGYPEDSE